VTIILGARYGAVELPNRDVGIFHATRPEHVLVRLRARQGARAMGQAAGSQHPLAEGRRRRHPAVPVAGPAAVKKLCSALA
jgi:hypothetical protein